MSADVLERKALQPGKAFIKQGEENNHAYVIQDGEVVSYKKKGDHRIEIAHFGPGTIIGETNLMLDQTATLSYEASGMCTVITISRQDFQKLLARADKSIVTILEHAVNKLRFYENLDIGRAMSELDIDDLALQLVQNLLKDLPLDKKAQYEEAILPHINSLIKSIKEIKMQNKKEPND